MNKLKEMNKQEVWTNAFGKRFNERVCVGVEYPYCVNGGEKFKPTKEEINNLWEDYLTQELGSKEQRDKEFEREFGHLTKGTPEENKKAFEKEFGTKA